MRILIVEDREQMASLMADSLVAQGYVVDIARSIAEAKAAVDIGEYALMTLDLGLCDGSGESLLRDLRQSRSTIPVLVASAQDRTSERIRLLDLGADDFLVKPFSLEELVARVRVLLRRPAEQVSTLLSAGNVVLDTRALTVSIKDTGLRLPRSEFNILRVLLKHQGQVLSHDRMVRLAYPIETEITPNALEAAISRLRRRMEAVGARLRINCLRGLGYILTEQTDT